MIDSLDPSLLAFFAATCMAVARTLYRGALLRLGPGMTALISSAITLQFAWGFYYFSGGLERWPLRGVAWFVAVGLIGGLAGRYMSFYAMKTVGMARTAVLMQTSLLWSSLLAILFLGERLTPPVAIGSAAIMLGSILLVHRSEEERKNIPRIYYAIPLAAAVLQGFSHLFRKFGFAWLESVPLGLSISNTVATLSLFAITIVAKESAPRFWEGRPLLLITIGALFNSMAMISFWVSIFHGEIVKIIPINRLSIPLIIFFSWVFFRKQEALTWRVAAGGLMSVVGAWSIVWGK